MLQKVDIRCIKLLRKGMTLNYLPEYRQWLDNYCRKRKEPHLWVTQQHSGICPCITTKSILTMACSPSSGPLKWSYSTPTETGLGLGTCAVRVAAILFVSDMTELAPLQSSDEGREREITLHCHIQAVKSRNWNREVNLVTNILAGP
jgi:hypothetical protein